MIGKFDCFNSNSLSETEVRQLMLRIEGLARLEGLREDRQRVRIPESLRASIDGKAFDWEVFKRDGSSILEGPFVFKALSSEPDDPENGIAVMWLGDIGDIMIKISMDGVTKTAVLVDFSEL